MKRRHLLLAAAALLPACDDTASSTTDGNAIILDLSSPTADMATPQADLATPPDLAMPPDMALPTTRTVFADDYGPNVAFLPFGGATNKVSVDPSQHHSGTAALKIEIPAGGYTGGALKVAKPEDLSRFNAVTFWARTEKPGNAFDTVGMGNDAATATYSAEIHALALKDAWTQYTIPVPDPAKFQAQGGLFHFATGGNGPYSVWLDDIQYAILDANTLGTPAPAIATETQNKLVGDSFTVNGCAATWSGGPITVSMSPGFMTFTSSDAKVATVDAAGTGTALAAGTTDITATLGKVAAAGKTTVVVKPAMAPNNAPPRPAGMWKSISLLSDALMNVPVSSWRTDWSNAVLTDVMVGGDHMKKYSALAFVGIETTAQMVDASKMTTVHLDVWTPDSTVFKIKLVDFGANAGFGGGDDTECELVFDANSMPKLVQSAWVSLEIPLSKFTTPGACTEGGNAALTKTPAHLAQYILSGSNSTLWLDNFYFHD